MHALITCISCFYDHNESPYPFWHKYNFESRLQLIRILKFVRLGMPRDRAATAAAASAAAVAVLAEASAAAAVATAAAAVAAAAEDSSIDECSVIGEPAVRGLDLPPCASASGFRYYTFAVHHELGAVIACGQSVVLSHVGSWIGSRFGKSPRGFSDLEAAINYSQELHQCSDVNIRTRPWPPRRIQASP